MEPKKLKKLVLKKDVISKLDNFEMNQMRGGTIFYTCRHPCTTGAVVESNIRCSNDLYETCVCYPSGDVEASCIPGNCYGGGYENTWPYTQCGGGLCNYL